MLSDTLVTINCHKSVKTTLYQIFMPIKNTNKRAREQHAGRVISLFIINRLAHPRAFRHSHNAPWPFLPRHTWFPAVWGLQLHLICSLSLSLIPTPSWLQGEVGLNQCAYVLSILTYRGFEPLIVSPQAYLLWFGWNCFCLNSQVWSSLEQDFSVDWKHHFRNLQLDLDIYSVCLWMYTWVLSLSPQIVNQSRNFISYK